MRRKSQRTFTIDGPLLSLVPLCWHACGFTRRPRSSHLDVPRELFVRRQGDPCLDAPHELFFRRRRSPPRLNTPQRRLAQETLVVIGGDLFKNWGTQTTEQFTTTILSYVSAIRNLED